MRAESNLRWGEKSVGGEEVETMRTDNSLKKLDCERNEGYDLEQIGRASCRERV